MSRAVVTAVIAHLRTVDHLALHEGGAPNNAPLPYAVLYADLGLRTSQQLSGLSDRTDHTWQITSVGLTPEQAQMCAERAADALIDKRLTVAGLQLGLIRHVLSRPVQRDDDEAPPLFYAVDQYAVTATPA